MKEHHISEPRINDRIRVPEVRLVGPNGEQVGIVRVEDALRLAQEADLDLVEVAPQARPPVCKLMDFGKFKYESAIKDREARKNQAHTVLKEIRLRLKIDPHDYGTKKGHVERFLNAGDKVKVMIMFRGREQSRPEMGYRLLQRMAADVAELGYVESTPKQDGRNMIMVIGPHKKKAEAKAEHKASRPPRVRDNSDDEMRDDSEEFEDEDAIEAAPVPVAATAAPTPAPNTNPADGPVSEDGEPIFVKRVTPPPSAAPAAGSSSYSSRPPSSSSSSRPPSSSSSSRPPSSSSGSRPPSTGRPFSPSGPSSSPSSRPSSSGPSGSSSAPSSSGPSGSSSGSTSSSAPASRPAPAPAARPTPAARPAPAPGSATPGTAPRPGPRPMPGPPPKPGPARPGPAASPAPSPAPSPAASPAPSPSPRPKDKEDAPKASESEQAAADA
ncbi:MAG TPA: translation initiation factor IF-3 [Kineosporiaceae bacterium]|nr:translation initiation factor IF-3 [Kineosporiaceae bacterium]